MKKKRKRQRVCPVALQIFGSRGQQGPAGGLVEFEISKKTNIRSALCRNADVHSENTQTDGFFFPLCMCVCVCVFTVVVRVFIPSGEG